MQMSMLYISLIFLLSHSLLVISRSVRIKQWIIITEEWFGFKFPKFRWTSFGHIAALNTEFTEGRVNSQQTAYFWAIQGIIIM